MWSRSDSLPKMEECKAGRVYMLSCRNLNLGVYDGNGGFIGIRTKFGSRYLFIEYHWDKDPHIGTVSWAEDTNFDVPNTVQLKTSLGTVDWDSNRPLAFDKPRDTGGKGWYFVDTGEAAEDVRPVSVSNDELFNILDKLERELNEEEEKRQE